MKIKADKCVTQEQRCTYFLVYETRFEVSNYCHICYLNNFLLLQFCFFKFRTYTLANKREFNFESTPVHRGGPVVIILATGSEDRGFGRGRWIFSERKNPEYDFLRQGSNAEGPVS